MSWDLVLRHCAALRATIAQTRASLDLAESQVSALEALVRVQIEREAAPTAQIELPALCRAYKEEDCGRQSDSGVNEMGGMGKAGRTLMCRGCGETLPAVG